MEYRGRKYRELYVRLCSLTAQEWRASFDEIEAIIGDKLPPAARSHRAWWANGSAMVQERAWKAAGWKTAEVNMAAETLAFRRILPPPARRRSIAEILPPRSFGPWPEGLSLRREDLYEDRI